MNNYGYPGVLDDSPDMFEQWVVRVVATYLDVCLEDLGPVTDRRLDVVCGVRLGIKRRGGKAIRSRPGELGSPLIQPRRHLRLVRVDQRGETAHAELPQHFYSLGFRCPIGNRPFAT